MKFLSRVNPAIQKIQPRTIRRLFGHFGRYLRPHWRALLTAWVCMVGASAMELLRPWPIKLIFDNIFAPTPRTGFLEYLPSRGGHTGTFLAVTSLSILVIAVLAGLSRYGEAYLTASVGHKVMAAIRRQLYSHMQRLSRSFHDIHHSGDLVMRLTGDINQLRELMISSVLFVSENLLILLGMVAIMFWMDWQLTFIALGILPLLTLVALFFSGRIKKAASKQKHRESEIASVVSETLSAITVVQAFARDQYESERFSHKNQASLKAGLQTMRLEVNLNRFVEILVAAGTCTVLWMGAKKVLAGVLSPGDLLVFTAYLTGLYKPIRKLASLTSRIAKASAGGERVISILETEPEIKDAPDAIMAPRFQGEISFENVHFRYRPGEPILNGISFTVKPGQTVALVGPSGVGKSTIANLCLRFYDPWRGLILIDGTDIRRYMLASLRDQVAIVLQEAVLFTGTIWENITYGKPNADMEEIVAAAKAANAHDFILELEHGYQTLIGERGGTLSGGQRQRIAIARTLIRNAPILILDEPMTGLDVESEATVREALKRLMVGKACLLITHDLQAVAEADHILVLEEGRIIEQGRHADLVAGNGRYRQFWELGTSRHGAERLRWRRDKRGGIPGA